MAKCKSFNASINKQSKILILGSMPGVKSLEAQEYYAHPQNRFWKVMSFLCNVDLTNLEYSQKLKTLLLNNIALWDVISDCNRVGSLDSAIENEHPNDIENLLKTYSGIEIICLNGNKAYSAFKKHFKHIIECNRYTIYKMPSTSPANARFQMPQLIAEWKILRQK